MTADLTGDSVPELIALERTYGMDETILFAKD